jgi:hypothetical protein
MSVRTRPYRLLEAFHLRTDRQVVDRHTLEPMALVEALWKEGGAVGDEWVRGTMAWAACRAGHQMQLRSVRPALRATILHKRMANELRAMDQLLARHDAMLLPGGAHPWMDPAHAAVSGLHGDAGMWASCQRLFGCRSHGWLNSAGSRLFITFQGDEEFTKLHAAVRLLLPIMPALSAASPFLDGRYTGFLDARMEAYLHTHEELPDLMGSLVPEAVFNQEDYYRTVYGPIATALADQEAGELDHELMNVRGAVPHFDQGLLEIRVLDAQECAAADLAIAEFIMVVLKALVGGRWVSTYLQRAWPETDLLAIFLQVIKDGGNTLIANRDYLLMLGMMNTAQLSAHKVWQHLFVELYGELSENAQQQVAHILEHGCLGSRILERTGREPDRDQLRKVYGELAECLRKDRPFP